MICWMLHPTYNEKWQRFPSIKAARSAFDYEAGRAVNRFGQSEESWGSAWVVVQREEPGDDVYPSFILRYDFDEDRVFEEQT